MIREFLEQYRNANDLDGKRYDCYFNQGVDRADFLLFENQAICEVKEVQNIKIQHQVEKLARKGSISEQNFKRDFYNSINKALRKANKQIKESKDALNCSNVLGLVILENLIQSDLSVLSLIDAANRKMSNGLEHIDGVLCIDMVNTFSNSEKKPIRPTQLVLRDTERSAQLSKLLQPLIRDFCKYSGSPFYDGFTIGAGEQVWQTDQNGRYHTYEAKFDWQTPKTENTSDWKAQIAEFLNRWWWLIPLPAILYDWFVR